MNNASEIRKLADTRLAEAKLLLDKDYCEGALYLAGYCIELLLKAKIADLLDIQNLFDDNFSPKEFRKPYYTHNLKWLLKFAGLQTKFDKAKATDMEFFTNWSLIEETWNEHCRYKQCGTCLKKDIQKFITAIENPQKGVKQWINTQ